MNKQVCRRLYDRDITSSLKSIHEETSIIKKSIFKSALMKNNIDKSIIDHYLNCVNGFIKYWDGYSKELMDLIKGSKGSTGIYSISYQWIKDKIYADYDYASILQFVDGVIQLCKNSDVKVDTIVDFKEHTISKAFKDLPLSIAELLDSSLVSVNRNGLSVYTNVDEIEAKLFDSIRSYKMFKETDRKELYKAVDYTISFISKDSNIGKYFNLLTTDVFISAINNIFDYIAYAISVFACRIYTISCYAFPYIENNNHSNIITPIGESVKTEELKGGYGNAISAINIMKEIDNVKYVKCSNGSELFKIIYKFLKEIGANIDKECDEINRYYADEYYNRIPHSESNVFVKDILSNPIIKYYSSLSFRSYEYDRSGLNNVTEVNQIIKEMMYNSNQAIACTNSPKQELFHSIRAVNPKKISECKDAAVDLYMFGVAICGSTACLIKELSMFRESEQKNPRFQTSALNIAAETIKILNEFYNDFVTIFIAKGRDIESRINNLRAAEERSINSKISLSTDISPNDILMTSIPDTTRMPVDMIDVYAKPVVESFELYDEYSKYILNAENDLYFSEAFKISDILNTISSIVIGAWKRLLGFFNDRTVKQAIEWVSNHQQQLSQLDFSGVEMYVLPYKIDIGIHPQFNNLITGIKNFNEKDIENVEAIDNFIKKLYPNDTVYGWFNNDGSDNKAKAGAAIYRNYMLFYNEGNATENAPQEVLIKDTVISRNVKEWVKTMVTLKSTVDSYKHMGDEITTSVNSMKTKVVAINNDDSSSNDDKAPSIGGDDDNNKSTNSQDNKNNNTMDSKVGPNINIALARTNTAVSNLYVSLNGIFVEYIKAMYSYLQEAYSKGRK